MDKDWSPFRFAYALVRAPAESAVGGLRAVDRGAPDIARFRAEHEAYCDALAGAGLSVIRLPPLEAFPDSVFVEDPALVLPQAAIMLQAAALSRAGEGEHLRSALAVHRPLIDLPEGHVDGGDILVTDREIMIGLSARTDRAGATALANLLGDWGYATRCVVLPRGLLHLKTGCALLGASKILAVGELASSGLFDGYDIVDVPDGEAVAANAIRVNDRLFVPAGYPATSAMLSAEGFDVIEIPAAQAALLDGGLSCMSLRF